MTNEISCVSLRDLRVVKHSRSEIYGACCRERRKGGPSREAGRGGGGRRNGGARSAVGEDGSVSTLSVEVVKRERSARSTRGVGRASRIYGTRETIGITLAPSLSSFHEFAPSCYVSRAAARLSIVRGFFRREADDILPRAAFKQSRRLSRVRWTLYIFVLY